MDSKPRHTAGPKPCRSSDALAIYWRLNRVVWVAGKKLGKRDKDRLSAAQRVHTTNDRDLLPSRPQRAFHKRHLAIGERALDGFETGLVKLCESAITAPPVLLGVQCQPSESCRLLQRSAVRCAPECPHLRASFECSRGNIQHRPSLTIQGRATQQLRPQLPLNCGANPQNRVQPQKCAPIQCAQVRGR
jgi:hypothetical protein